MLSKDEWYQSAQIPQRILILAGCNSKKDTRLNTIANLCAQTCRTDVISYTQHNQHKPSREYDEFIYTELLTIENEQLTGKLDFIFFVKLFQGFTMLFLTTVTSINSFFSMLQKNYFVPGLLYRRARVMSITPKVIICLDLAALIAGVRLKVIFGCFLIYSPDQFGVEANSQSQSWGEKPIRFLERRLQKRVDIVLEDVLQLNQILEPLFSKTTNQSTLNSKLT